MSDGSPAWMPPWWSPSQRGVVIALLSAMFLYLAVRLFFDSQYVAEPQPLVPPRAAQLQHRIDPNTADAATLAALPLIGEKRARDIIAYREQFVAEHSQQPAFSRPHDLLRVKGIGLNTLEQIAPFLLFPPADPPTTAP